MKKKPGCLGYMGDYTTQLIGDDSKPSDYLKYLLVFLAASLDSYIHLEFSLTIAERHMSSVLNSICIGHFFGLLEFIPVVSFFLKFVRYP